MQYNNIVVDCYLLAYRSWWPVRDLTTSEGIPSGLEYGFIKNILTAARLWVPGKLVLAWDGFPKRCNEIFPKKMEQTEKGLVEVGYKSGRAGHEDKDTEPAWTPRLCRLRDCFQEVAECLYHPETEADEEIARFVFAAESRGETNIIISKDRDLHQLVSDKTHICLGPEENLMTPEAIFKEKDTPWGVPCHKIPLRRAIEGDGSDAIKGVPRIPKDVVINLVNASNDIDHMIENISKGAMFKSKTQLEKMLEGRDLIRRNYALSELQSQRNYPPNYITKSVGNTDKLMALIDELEMHSLKDRKEWFLLRGENTPQSV